MNVREDEKMYSQAANKIGEYRYRKLFGLSKQQMLSEPLEDYYTNLHIDNTIDEKAQYENKRSEMRSKVRYGKTK